MKKIRDILDLSTEEESRLRSAVSDLKAMQNLPDNSDRISTARENLDTVCDSLKVRYSAAIDLVPDLPAW